MKKIPQLSGLYKTLNTFLAFKNWLANNNCGLYIFIDILHMAEIKLKKSTH